jgi:hypothetical protein
MIASYRHSQDVAPMPDAEACFAVLRARSIRVALNTAFSRDIAQTIVDRCEEGFGATDQASAGRAISPRCIVCNLRCASFAEQRQLKAGDHDIAFAFHIGAAARQRLALRLLRRQRH